MSEAIAEELGEDCDEQERIDGIARARARLIPDEPSTSCDNHYPNYGSFRGGDPRLFVQDEEGRTEEERLAHFNACRAFDLNPSSTPLPAEMCSRSVFGYGVNWCCAKHLAANEKK
jgi:hypothetical protein